MNKTKRLIIKELPKGWELRKNCEVQDGSQYEYRWAVLNEYRRIVFVGKTLDRIREQIEGFNEEYQELYEQAKESEELLALLEHIEE